MHSGSTRSAPLLLNFQTLMYYLSPVSHLQDKMYEVPVLPAVCLQLIVEVRCAVKIGVQVRPKMAHLLRQI